MPSPNNLKLKASVLITGHWVTETDKTFTAVYSWKSGSSKTNDNVVMADGTINLVYLDRGNNLSRSTDIEFVIDPQSTWADAGGTAMNLSFPTNSPPIDITGDGVSTEFIMNDTPNPNSVAFTDVDDNSNTYNYCLHINSQYQGDQRNFIFSLDPTIVNRPPGVM